MASDTSCSNTTAGQFVRAYCVHVYQPNLQIPGDKKTPARAQDCGHH